MTEITFAEQTYTTIPEPTDVPKCYRCAFGHDFIKCIHSPDCKGVVYVKKEDDTTKRV